MKRFTGLSACKGTAAGIIACIPDTAAQAIPVHAIDSADIQAEKDRLKKALTAAQTQLSLALTEQLTTDIRAESPEQTILETHRVMLADEVFIESVYTEITESMMNAEYVLKRKLDELIIAMTASGDTYLSERAIDIRDAYEPVFSYLTSQQQQAQSRFGGIMPGAILAARILKPSEALEIKRRAPRGIVIEEGGVTSHIAIMARAWNIPMLVAVSGLMQAVQDGMYAVLDATQQLLILEPDEQTQIRIQNREDAPVSCPAQSYESVYTADGVPVRISANIAFPEDIEDSLVQQSAGIGLFRSEFLFLGKALLPSEEEQYTAYCTVLKEMGTKPVLIRTFDAGADKMLEEQKTLSERNALLGWRAIRYCLDRPTIFKTQLRALLRAGCTGNLHILLPMISCKKEITAVQALIKELELECEQQHIPYKKDIPLGIMVEVPSAAIAAELYAPAVDFFSIGTNDLIQYTVAVDRENQTVAHLADCFHPAVLRLIRHVIEAAPLLRHTGDSHGSFVSMCGEMASDADAVPLLLGMGLRSFSMSPQKIPEIAQRIAAIRLSDAEALYHAACSLDCPEEIRRLIRQRFPV